MLSQSLAKFFCFVQLGQKQRELDRLQKENNVLKGQLENAIGREQSAREGYVLQVLHSLIIYSQYVLINST